MLTYKYSNVVYTVYHFCLTYGQMCTVIINFVFIVVEVIGEVISIC